MDNHVYKQIELTGTSTTGIEDAVTGAVAKAAETMRHLRWLEVTDIRAHLDGRNLTHWQVTVKVGFTLED